MNLSQRLATFAKWTRVGNTSAITLAKQGYYYNQNNRAIQCVKCHDILHDITLACDHECAKQPGPTAAAGPSTSQVGPSTGKDGPPANREGPSTKQPSTNRELSAGREGPPAGRDFLRAAAEDEEMECITPTPSNPQTPSTRSPVASMETSNTNHHTSALSMPAAAPHGSSDTGRIGSEDAIPAIPGCSTTTLPPVNSDTLTLGSCMSLPNTKSAASPPQKQQRVNTVSSASHHVNAPPPQSFPHSSSTGSRGRNVVSVASVQMEVYQNRLDSFKDWPATAFHVAAVDLAKAGFYYVGPGDRVKCAFCQKKIKDWEAGDIPIDEHRRLSPMCSLFSQMEVNR